MSVYLWFLLGFVLGQLTVLAASGLGHAMVQKDPVLEWLERRPYRGEDS